jgi:hypothetical protein
MNQRTAMYGRTEQTIAASTARVQPNQVGS